MSRGDRRVAGGRRHGHVDRWCRHRGSSTPHSRRDRRPRPRPQPRRAAVQLPAPAAVGQQADVAARISHTTAAGGVRGRRARCRRRSRRSTVTARTRRARRSARSTSRRRRARRRRGQQPRQPRSFEQSFTPTGAANPAGIDADQRRVDDRRSSKQSGRALVDAVSMVSVGFPAEPVAVGAAWTSEGTIGSHGTIVPVTYQCRLTALDASTYTMEVTYTAVVQPAERHRNDRGDDRRVGDDHRLGRQPAGRLGETQPDDRRDRGLRAFAPRHIDQRRPRPAVTS